MASTGHSPLLKYLLPAENITTDMSERYIIISEPNNVESEVPGEQNMRESTDDVGTLVPVITITKSEAAFTKGDMKLQKVAVTENISGADGKQTSLHGEVLHDVHPIRNGGNAERRHDDPTTHGKERVDEKKSRTRIPMTKFRQTVEKVKKERRDSRESLETPAAYAPQKRRTSIPRPRGSKIPPPSVKKEDNPKKNEKIVKDNAKSPKSECKIPTLKHNQDQNVDKSEMNEVIDKDIIVSETFKEAIARNDQDSTVDEVIKSTEELEDEFDKIYDEIVDDTRTDALIDENIYKIEDPEKLETSFDEIMHAYEEPVGKLKSKIPFAKQKSLHEAQIPKQLDRRASLETNVYDDGNRVQNTSTEAQIRPLEVFKRDEYKTQEVISFEEVTVQEIPTNYDITTETSEITTPINNADATDDELNTKEDGQKENYEILVKETVKVAKPVFPQENNVNSYNIVEMENALPNELENINLSVDIPDSSRLVRNISISPVSSPKQHVDNEPDFDKEDTIHFKEPLKTEIKKESLSNIPVLNKRETLKAPSDPVKDKSKDLQKDETSTLDIPIEKGKVSTILNKFNSMEPTPYKPSKKDVFDEIPNKKSTASRIATFTRKREVHSESKTNISVPEIRQEPITLEVVDIVKQEDKTDVGYDIEQSQKPQLFDESTSNYSKLLKSDFVPLSLSYEVNYESEGKEIAVEEEIVSQNVIVIEPQETIPIKEDAETYPNEENNNELNASEQGVLANSINETKDHDNMDEIEDIMTNEKEVVKNIDNTAVIDQVDGVAEEIPVLKGNVNRIISRLNSNESTNEVATKDIVAEITKKKSVSSRIAMFESKAPTTKIPRADITPCKPREVDTTKPKIIDQILKAQPIRVVEDRKDKDATVSIPNEDKFKTNEEITIKDVQEDLTLDNHAEHNEKIADDKNIRNPWDFKESNAKNYVDVDEPNIRPREFEPKTFEDKENNPIQLTYGRDLARTDDFDSTPAKDKADSAIAKENQRKLINKKHGEDNEVFLRKTKELSTIEERLNRMQSRNEEFNMRRTKSVAELDIGDAVKGKVHRMIVRINSVECLDVDLEKKEVINIKERPRKRSVSEKIALFEKKLTPVQVQEKEKPATPLATKSIMEITTPAPSKIYTEEQYQAKIAELKSAKLKYGSIDEMKIMTLADGVEMPVIALGTALLEPRLLPHIIGAAIDLGYRAFDTAYIYGNEAAVGAAIRAKIEDGTVTRRELFIISKLWSTFHRSELVEKACRHSLQAMGLDYFDLYLIHHPMSFKEGGDALPTIANVLQYSEADYMDAWFGMEPLLRRGLARALGVSNFNSVQLGRVLEKGHVKPAVLQVECHPYLAQHRLSEFCQARGVMLTCYGVLGSKGTPAEYKGHAAAVVDDPLVKVLAAGRRVSPAKLLLKYQMERGHGVVVKASCAEHLWDNLQALATQLTAGQVAALDALNRNKRTYAFIGMGDTHKNYPFKIPF